MSAESDTPRTDAAARAGAYLSHGDYPETFGKQIVHIDFARQLERELAEARRIILNMNTALHHASREVAELQSRLIDRTAAYEKKDAEQVRRIQELCEQTERLKIRISSQIAIASQAESDLKEAVEMLRKVQNWITNNAFSCFMCGGINAHQENCRLAAILKKHEQS